jgi:hypothetical protein
MVDGAEVKLFREEGEEKENIAKKNWRHAFPVFECEDI